MAEALISFRGVQKAFGPKVVYSCLDLDVQRGETLTVIGGSGVGKSVMLKMLIGLLTPDAGSIRFDGRELSGARERDFSDVRRRIAMLFQAGALFDSLTVGENVSYGLQEHYWKTMTAADIRQRVAWALECVNLRGIEAMSTADLSGGMRKRVGLARAIALKPEVLLYDEPTTGLDPINTARVNHLIRGLKQRLEITSIVVTHDMKSAFSISDRIAMVQGGRVIFEGAVDAFREADMPYIHDFVEGRAPEEEDLQTLLHS